MKWDRTQGRPEPIAALNRIVEVENGEPLVEMSVACPSLVRLRPGTIGWCRRSVATMAESAAQSLPAGIQLGYSEAWRPLVRQRMIFDWMWEQLEVARPGLSYAAKRRQVCRWVAPVDQKAPPGHCTGAALDVYLLDDQGAVIDLVSPLTRFGSAPTYVHGLDPVSQANRSLLINAMLGSGFSNCRDEFWHYSFGDAGWAVRTDNATCSFGLVELDPQHWEHEQKIWEAGLVGRPNPFLPS